jgi:L-aspartate oxidase
MSDRAAVEDATLTATAAAVVAAAAARTESRGCHHRGDHLDTDPALAVSAQIRLDADGQATVALPVGAAN